MTIFLSYFYGCIHYISKILANDGTGFYGLMEWYDRVVIHFASYSSSYTEPIIMTFGQQRCKIKV